MELRQIDRTDRGKNRLYEALNIYRETILPEAQNPERQILYWIEHSKEVLADEFRCFSLLNGNAVIGYLQYSFFREEKLFFFEYLCIRDLSRLGLLPSKAVKTIENFLAQNYPPGFTIIFEVAQKRNKNQEWEPDKKLISYFKRLGFRTVDFPYHYPILQSYDGAVSYPADLMILLPDQRTVVTASEMRTILRCIYFKHYLRWDRPFLEPERFVQRERLINDLYSHQVQSISDNDSFGTRGDDKRSQMNRFLNVQPAIGQLLDRVFGPKFFRVLIVICVLLVTEWILGSGLLLIPFVLAVALIYCLMEDTEDSQKLFTAVLSRLRLGRLRSQ
jgi:hypothetical protein